MIVALRRRRTSSATLRIVASSTPDCAHELGPRRGRARARGTRRSRCVWRSRNVAVERVRIAARPPRSTALATPRSSARSPPIRGCTFMRAGLGRRGTSPSSTKSCGTIVRRDAASTSGLTWTTCAPRRSASASAGEHPRRVRGGVVADHDRSRRPAPSRRGRRCPCRCRSTRSARGRSPRGTCSSSPAGCSCRTRAPRAGRGTSPRCRAGPRCRTTPRSGSPARAASSPTSANASSHEIGTYVSLAGVVAQRLGEPPTVLEREVAPAGELGDGVGGEELARRPCLRVSSHVTCLIAVLADVEVQAAAGRPARRSPGSRSPCPRGSSAERRAGPRPARARARAPRATLRAAPQPAAGWW